MFDARSILDILVGSGQGKQGRPPDRSVLKDMLDQLGDQDAPPAGYPPTSGTTAQQPGGSGGGGSLEDLLRGVLSQIQQGPASAGDPQAAGGQSESTAVPEVGKELQDLLRHMLGGALGGLGQSDPGAPLAQASRPTGGDATGTPGGAAGLAEVLRQVLGQAVAGAREGAARIDDATGLSDKAREALAQATGQSPEEVMAQLRQLVTENRLAAGATLGGLGALLLGTGAGRSLATTAIKLGGLALIGGLAYKAYQNYEQGKPPLEIGAKPQALIAAPAGSGFEAGAVTHDAARRYIRAMIAAAAADGRIDAQEQQRILGGLRQAGLDDAAQQFLAAEITSPATVAELASGVSSPEEALQVYTAARIAVDPDTAGEHAFLSALAEALGIDNALAAQVDAAAVSAAA